MKSWYNNKLRKYKSFPFFAILMSYVYKFIHIDLQLKEDSKWNKKIRYLKLDNLRTDFSGGI